MPELLIVATPIGHLGDLSDRMRDALSRADLILAEDTRVTLKLLNHFDIQRPLLSCHRHNEASRATALIERMLAEDLTVALTCDAGTPAISDPGAVIVRAAHAAHIRVTPICGPSAVTAALSVSGFDARAFAFYGFPPRETKPLVEQLKAVRKTGIPVAVFYESPHRIAKLVEVITTEWPGCSLCICSDISKRYEWIYSGPCEEALHALNAREHVEKGEYCLVADLSELEAIKEEAVPVDALTFLVSRVLKGDELSDAVQAAQALNYSRNELYKAKLRVRSLLPSN